MLEALQKSLQDNSSLNAFCINDIFYTYQELNEKVLAISAAMGRLGGSKTGRIGIVTTNSIETYASVLACWFSGYAYIPLSPDIPKQRNAHSVEQADIDIILTSESDPDRITGPAGEITYIDTAVLKDGKDSNMRVSDTGDASLMYILFTSGSTGTPKGVPINYENLKAFIDSYEFLGFDSSAKDRFLQMFDLTFDVSVASYLIPLLKGACVYTIPAEGIKYMNVFKVLKKYEITFASIVPSIINYLNPYFAEIDLPHLKYCILTAEASAVGNVTKWAKCMPNGVIVNLYGPTEATIWCTGYNFDTNSPKSYHEMLAIGRPFKNVTAFILDESGNEAGEGVKGELCIASTQLTTGYLNNEEKTRLAFLFKDGHRLYKTGDLCYRDAEANIFYCGRIDHQVKIQGFRIELNEIEAVVKGFTGITNIAVVYKNKLGIDQICLFLEKYSGGINELKQQIEQKLPYYMIPSQIKVIDQLPHNTSAKVDRVKLSMMANESGN